MSACILSLVPSLLGSVSSFYHDFVCEIQQKIIRNKNGAKGKIITMKGWWDVYKSDKTNFKKAKDVYDLESGLR